MGKSAGKVTHPWGIIFPGVVFSMLEQAIKDAERILGIPGEVIFKEGLKRFLKSKVDENNKLITGLKKKYGAPGYVELEEKIKKGDVPEHPTWEDVILWEELSRHNAELNNLILRLETGEAVAS